MTTEYEFIEKKIDEYLDIYKHYYSNTTLERYRNALKRLFVYLKGLRREIVKSIDEQRKPDMDTVVNDLIDWTYKSHSGFITGYASFIGFARWLFGKEFVASVKENIKFPKVKKRSPRIINDYKKINALIDMMDEPFDTMARVQWETSCRAGAVLKLTFEVPSNTEEWVKINKVMDFHKVNLGDNQNSFYQKGKYYYIKLKEKGQKVHERPIKKDTYDWIKSYAEFRKQQMLHFIPHLRKDKLKPIWFRKVFSNKIFNVTHQWYNRILLTNARALDIPKFSSHWLRGTRGRHLLDNKVNPVDIMNFMGHSSLNITLRYIDLPIKGKEDLFLDTLSNV